MFNKTSLNLDIQIQYLDILRGFLDSEYKALQYGQTLDVYQLEKSIHEILRTVLKKRLDLREELMGASVREYASEMPEHIRKMLYRKLDTLAELEKDCLEKTTRNADLSLILAGKKMAVPEHWNVFPRNDTAGGRVQ